MRLPELQFIDGQLERLVSQLANEAPTLFVVDPHNAPLPGPGEATLVVRDIYHTDLPATLDASRYQRVVAIGGCSALDMGRFLAGDRELVVVPTVLSTSCISCDLSIVRRDGQKRSLRTTAPTRTIIPLRAILDTPPAELRKWCASGFGDLFANISATACHAIAHKELDVTALRGHASEAFAALDWALGSFTGYDEEAIRRLAGHLHRASVEVVRVGHNVYSAGFEHVLYEQLIRDRSYTHDSQTHGILVSIGTLLVAHMVDRMETGTDLAQQLRQAYGRVGLPSSLAELAHLGIRTEHLLAAFEELRHHDNFLTRHVRMAGESVLAAAYGLER